MLVAAVLISASVASLLPLRKGPPRLSDQVDASTLVCIGIVDQEFTVSIPGGIAADATQLDSSRKKSAFQFGRVRVERVLKGDPRTTVVFHEAWSTWTCDTTIAMHGKRALFFL